MICNMSLCSNVICGAVFSFMKTVFGKNCFGNYLVKPNLEKTVFINKFEVSFFL